MAASAASAGGGRTPDGAVGPPGGEERGRARVGKARRGRIAAKGLRRARLLRICLGLAVAALASAVAYLALEGAMRERGGLGASLARCWRAFWRGGVRVRVRFPSTPGLRPGDRVFHRAGPRMAVVGVVREIAGRDVALDLSPAVARRAGGRTRFTLVRGSGTAAWIASRLLTPGRIARILGEWERAAPQWQAAFAQELEPLLRAAASDGTRALVHALPEVTAARSARWQALFEGPGRRILRARIEPILAEEVWPVVRERASPEVEAFGRELWERLPLWSLGTRWLWEQLPGTPNDLVDAEWRRFLAEDALPALEARLPRWGELLQAILEEAFAKPRVRDATERAVLAFLREPELGAVLQDTAADLAQRVGRALEARLSSSAFRAALRRFAERVQPLIDRTLNHILLDRDGTGINPDLAWILRDQFLQKDRTWILIELAPDEAPASNFEGAIYAE